MQFDLFQNLSNTPKQGQAIQTTILGAIIPGLYYKWHKSHHYRTLKKQEKEFVDLKVNGEWVVGQYWY